MLSVEELLVWVMLIVEYLWVRVRLIVLNSYWIDLIELLLLS
jgi:hypothetical protein